MRIGDVQPNGVEVRVVGNVEHAEGEADLVAPARDVLRDARVEAEERRQAAGVALIPGEAFYADHPCPPGLLRAAFCKSREDIERALERLGRVEQTRPA